jgi:hypothetical protein
MCVGDVGRRRGINSQGRVDVGVTLSVFIGHCDADVGMSGRVLIRRGCPRGQGRVVVMKMSPPTEMLIPRVLPVNSLTWEIFRADVG